MMARILTIETPGLGDRSYVAHDGNVAIVVDPQRDIDRVLDILREEAVTLTHVFETHVHNDYVTGGLALAEATGAAYVVAEAEQVEFVRVPAKDGSVFKTGALVVTALETPGHTPGHLSYSLSEGGGEPSAVFTGGSMLFGAVGRTDLIGEDQTALLTHAQYRSVRKLAAELPASAAVLPTHGFGSFCSATPTSGDSSTIARERATNIALTTDDEEAFVKALIGGLNAYPRYYAHMGAANRKGARAPVLARPEPADASVLRKRIDAGEWVVDVRRRQAFAREHVTGTISVELGDPFATFLGWTIRWGTPLTLIGDSAEQVAQAQLALARIGIDELRGAGYGEVATMGDGRLSSYPTATFEDVAEVIDTQGVVLLDVRRPDEWEAGHLGGAIHIPFWELEDRMTEIPDGEIWAHCASGFRASISASLLRRAGLATVHVDEAWERAGQLQLPIES